MGVVDGCGVVDGWRLMESRMFRHRVEPTPNSNEVFTHFCMHVYTGEQGNMPFCHVSNL